MKQALLTRRGILLRPGVSHQALHVWLDGRHIWTFAPREAWKKAGVLIPWPDDLLNAMEGRSRFEVRSDDDTVLDRRTLAFGDEPGPIVLKDADGRILTVNKWGRLTHGFELQSGDARQRLIDHTAEVLERLRGHGFDSFIVGGTLLGAVRGGELLEHDDDADTAYLSKSSHPSDVALESFALQRAFEAEGYWIVKHSVTHFQVMFKTDSGHIDHFVDVFTAVFKDGRFYEPIHVDTDQVAPDDIVPTTTLSLGGVELAAPANPETWLAACYGPNWRTPDPTFIFETPEETKRRFHYWYGAVSMHRLWWDARYQRISSVRGPSEAVKRFAEQLPPNARVLEIACGTGADARYLASLGHNVLAVDYSWVAVDIARRTDDTRLVDFREANLYDRRQMLALVVEMLREKDPVYIYMRHAIDGVSNSGRLNAALVCRYLLQKGGFALMTSFASPGTGFDMYRPLTWHIRIADMYKTARECDLALDIRRSSVEESAEGNRVVLDTVITRKQED